MACHTKIKKKKMLKDVCWRASAGDAQIILQHRQQFWTLRNTDIENVSPCHLSEQERQQQRTAQQHIVCGACRCDDLWGV